MVVLESRESLFESYGEVEGKLKRCRGWMIEVKDREPKSQPISTIDCQCIMAFRGSSLTRKLCMDC